MTSQFDLGETAPTLDEHVNRILPAELLLDLRQTSTEDFFDAVGALKDAKATAAVAQLQVGEAQDACSMRLGSNLRPYRRKVGGDRRIHPCRHRPRRTRP